MVSSENLGHDSGIQKPLRQNGDHAIAPRNWVCEACKTSMAGQGEKRSVMSPTEGGSPLAKWKMCVIVRDTNKHVQNN